MRFILMMAAMFALPFLVWHVWNLLRLVPTAEGEDEQGAPNGMLALSGAVLALAAIVVVVLNGGAEEEGSHRPPPPLEREARAESPAIPINETPDGQRR